MKKVLLALALVVSSTSVAQATVVNFDDLVGQADVPDGYGGINWDGNWQYYGWAQDPYNPNSPDNRVYANYNKVGFGVFAVPFYFTSDVTFDGAFFSGTGGGVNFELYNDGTLVGVSGVLGTTNTATWLGSGYGGLVDEVRVYGNVGYYVMDDVTYNGGGTVPEPGTLMLLGSGLAGLVVARRRFRKAAK